MKEDKNQLIAGASSMNITPKGSLHLAGYPFTQRFSTGVHDPLLSSALYLSDKKTATLFIANDLIFVGKASVLRVRKSTTSRTGIPSSNILVSASHTHSGPSTVKFTAGSKDPLLPEVDMSYVEFMEERMITAGVQAFQNAQPAEIGLTVADATGIGTNRHHSSGPSDLEVPVLVVRNKNNKQYIACMLVCCMHPTVLHEDSKLYSGDFPGIAREIIQKEILKSNCPVLYNTGPAGNQSPRHVTYENTFQEARRLANILAKGVEKVVNQIEFLSDLTITCLNHSVDLPAKKFPGNKEVELHLEKAVHKLEDLKKRKADRRVIRTAEVNWFGALELSHLVKLSKVGALESVYKTCSPAEIQLIKIGPWTFIGWPGEIFVEYGLEIKNKKKNVFIITLANGELQGYIVTKEAAEEGGYEASNGIFDYKSGEVLVSETLHLLNNL
jgi:neutral ceramidase